MRAIDDLELKALAEPYALGALDAEQTAAFEAYLARSPEAQQEVAAYREVSALLAVAATDPAAAPGDLRARVLARVGREKTVALPPRRGIDWRTWAALAAGLVAVAALEIDLRRLRHELETREATMADLQSTLAAREAKLAAREATLNTILEPGVTLTRLVSTTAPAPGIQLFWNRKTNVAIAHAFNLTPAASGRVYQLWFIPKAGKPIPSVTFNSESSGHALVEQIRVPVGADLAAAAITDEPEGGSPQPTTTPILVGTFGAS